jgi:hemerythrin
MHERVIALFTNLRYTLSMMNEDSVTWDDEFLVHFDRIDEQHKTLVTVANDLFIGSKQGKTAADVAFMKTVRNAIEYAQTHFYTEEKYMALANYPDLPAHKKEHEAFVSEILHQVQIFETGEAEPVILARYLKNWLLNHIAISDKKYSPYLAKLEKQPEQT